MGGRWVWQSEPAWTHEYDRPKVGLVFGKATLGTESLPCEPTFTCLCSALAPVYWQLNWLRPGSWIRGLATAKLSGQP